RSPACCLFFSALSPPPPSSSLFPYTTLFRSSATVVAAAPPVARVAGTSVERGQPLLGPADRRRGTRPPGRGGAATPPRRAGGTGDRKSTRLNSSHQIISYAVFCLKKKNTTNT